MEEVLGSVREEAEAALAALGPVWEDMAAGALPAGYSMPQRPPAAGPAASGGAGEGTGGGGGGGGAPTRALAGPAASGGAGEGMGGGGGGGGGAPTQPQPADAVPRADTLHVRAWMHLAAERLDVCHFFTPLVVRKVEELNGVSVNVVFADAPTAARALENCCCAVPRIEPVPPVHPAWRRAGKPLVKHTRTDKRAPYGAVTTVWMRQATTHDTRALAKPALGAVVGVAGRGLAARLQLTPPPASPFLPIHTPPPPPGPRWYSGQFFGAGVFPPSMLRAGGGAVRSIGAGTRCGEKRAIREDGEGEEEEEEEEGE